MASIEPSQPPMHIYIIGHEFFGLLEFTQSIFIAPRLAVDDSQIEVGEGQRRIPTCSTRSSSGLSREI